MPGFKEQAKEIASSPERWREAMLQAKEQITTLKKQRDSMRAAAGQTQTQTQTQQGGAEATDSSYSNGED